MREMCGNSASRFKAGRLISRTVAGASLLIILGALAYAQDSRPAQNGDAATTQPRSVQGGEQAKMAPDAMSVSLVAAQAKDGTIEAYTLDELRRVLSEGAKAAVAGPTDRIPGGRNVVVLGTAGGNPAVKELISTGFLKAPQHPQGYSMRCKPNADGQGHWMLAAAGTDARGALYALRDLEHYEMRHFRPQDGQISAEAFERADYPRIEHRGHWIWGCDMPDKKAWLENMSRWKLNEWIEWDNYLPKKAKEYVDFAHSRGIDVVWGFGWGWNPSWNFKVPPELDRSVGGVWFCPSSEFNRRFFRREILKKVRELYVPTGADGIYFQSFTEGAKCQCPLCKGKTMGQLMLEFVNPIVDDIKKKFPNLWVSCGIHANYGKYDDLKQLDDRCNIYWENCNSGTSVRGPNEDFGYIYKSIPYGHGFSATCPADPPYTEESLRQSMQSNDKWYTLVGSIDKYRAYMRNFQQWGRNFLRKPSSNKHASVVADCSVFCRRTPFAHAALAEAQWNPDLDTNATVDALVDFLGLHPLARPLSQGSTGAARFGGRQR
jgi:hypothetical protein